MLICAHNKGGVHRYDENGLRNTEDEPPNIRKIHKEEIEFVKEWLKERRLLINNS